MSLFKSLGYVTIQTADIERWRQFAFNSSVSPRARAPIRTRCICGWTSAPRASS